MSLVLPILKVPGKKLTLFPLNKCISDLELCGGVSYVYEFQKPSAGSFSTLHADLRGIEK